MIDSTDFEQTQSKQNNDTIKKSVYTQSQQEYTTNINQLIAQPSLPSTTQFFLTNLFQLSQYLFRKKTQIAQQQDSSANFDFYLNSVSKQINIYEGLHKKARQLSSKQYKLQIQQSTQQLLQCYQKVPYVFFNNNFILDFGQLAKNIDQIGKRQQQLNDYLDMVQINLFSQIHNKFHQYFKVVANFQYLSQSLEINIAKNQQARQRINRVRVDFVQKSYKLKQKIAHRQNLQKTLKLVKIIKSLKKLPMIVRQILQSSLPYQCLSLLKSTKQSINQVSQLKCLDKVSQTIRESESLVQMGLNKRYADQLYLYLEESQNVNLQEGWDRINSNGCVDVSGFNNSMLGVSGFLQQSVLQMQPSTSKNKRNEGKQFEIALILLQSYKFMNFPVDLIRIKVSNSLRVFCKKFDTDLTECLKKILQQKNEKILQNQQYKQRLQKQSQPKALFKLQQLGDDQSALISVVEKITVIFYVKHLLGFNQIMKDTIDKLLGYLHTLLCQYDESKNKDQERFTTVFKQELSILPAISKIIIQKLTFLMTLKNINGVTFAQFKQWISVLQYWKRYTDYLVQQNPLVSMDRDGDQIEQAISQTLKKMIGVFNINATISELMINYVTLYHQNIINSELEPSFAQQSWQSVQIPSQFVQVLNNISQWHDPHVNQNISVTILNDSKQMKNLNKSLSQDYTNAIKKTTKFRVLKSNVIVQGGRYKISVSFLLLCEFIDQYVKMMRIMSQCRKFIYERMLNLVQYYNSRTKELILEAKARQFEKMKSKNISAKHICIVHNCLTVLIKLIKQINYPQITDLKSMTTQNIQTHKNQLIGKLSYLIKSKVQSTVAAFIINKQQKIAQVNLTLLNVFIQMMGIIDQFLQFQDKKGVFKESMEIFINKYFKQLLVKGAEYSTENKILVEKMRFLRQYFPDQFQLMEKQAKSRSNIQI